MRKALFILCSLIVVVFSLLCLAPKPVPAHQERERTVLILHSYHPGLSWTDDIMAGMQEGLGRQMDQLHVHTEYLDTQRFSHPRYYFDILDTVIHYKFQDRHFDLVLVADNTALAFVLEHRDDLFSGSPIVFCGINNFRPAMIADFGDITGIAEEPSFHETIATALELHPETREIVVVGGRANPTNRENRAMLTALLETESFDPAVRFTFWDDLPAAELSSRLQQLSGESLVLVNGSVNGPSGGALPYLEGMRLISEGCSRPVYSLWDFFIGKGIVGGKLVSGRQQGRLAARLGLRILQGEDADAIPVTAGPNRYLFDYAQMQKFDLDVDDLPEGSIVINRPPPFFTLSKKELGVALAAFMALSAFLFASILRNRRTQRKFREQKDQVDLLLDSAAEAIYGIDLQGKCTFCNEAVLRILGFEEEEGLLGKDIHDLIHHTRPDGTPYPGEECRVCHAYRWDEKVHVEDEIFWRADGTSFPVEYWSYPIRKEGRTIGAVVTFLDISERRAAEEKAREVVRELNAFVYTVAHDLRAPLTAIIGFADFLHHETRQGLDENGRTALREIESQGRRMSAMMEDLLALAKVGELPAPEEPVDLDAVLGKVLQNLQPQIAASGLEIRTRGLPPAKFPETLLSQVLSNLIGNAVTYAGSDGGPIEIEGRRFDSTVHISVRDHGPGVSAEDRQRLFEVFYRGAAGKKISGTGIGLATVQKIARQYHGRAWVEDTPGGGATFRVELVEA